MRFQYRIKAVTSEGIVKTDTSGIHIDRASEVVIYVTAATSFNGFNKCPDKDGKDEKELATQYLDQVLKQPYSILFKAHLADYQRYFNRCQLRIHDSTTTNSAVKLPADERLQAYSSGQYDPALETLYFQYGRYLLISSSRPNGPPANLQGIWNKELRAPWSSNYTININTEMNYWPAEVTNLSEMHMGLLNWIPNLAKTGRQTAQEYYRTRGWVAHHNSDIWALSNAVGDRGAGDPVWANWYMGGLPAVAKLLQGSQGVGVFLLETPQATNTALESMYKLKVPLKIQGFVDGKNKEIRAIVVGDKVAVAMERTANQGSFRANISQGGSGRKIELSDADKKMCVEAARAVDLRYAGVDLMKDDKGNSYIIEVNGNPGTKIVSITGYNHYTDLVAFIAGRVSQIKAKEGGMVKAVRQKLTYLVG
jgi:hypothetical protein